MKVLFFARLRETLGSESLVIGDSECPPDVAGLRALVLSRASGEFSEAFGDANVLCAVNQRVVDDTHPLTARDEVAFFPPMTGG